MRRDNYRLLSLAAASGKVGYVLMENGKPKDWGVSVKASKSPDNARALSEYLVKQYSPHCVVTEKINRYCRKSEHNRLVIQALRPADEKQIAAEVERRQDYPNKYEEIAALVEQFPQLEPWAVDERIIWLPEHRNTIIFEALSLALQMNGQSPTNLPT